MNVLVLNDTAAVGEECAHRVEALLGQTGAKGPRVGFPTGKTPFPFFAALTAKRKRGLATEQIRPFALDEYRGVPPSHPASFAQFLRRHVVEPLGVPPGQVLSFDGAATDAQAECARYERALSSDGGVDLVVLGLGANGHVAFNEPGSNASSVTRVLPLTPASIEAARAEFPNEKVPTEALSIGITTILAAREVILLVTGASKAAILSQALTGPQTPVVPASLVRDHPSFTVLADESAATQLPPEILTRR